MDAIDREIVELLLDNGRLSQEQIAQKVNLSRPAVHERIKRLEEHDVLRSYRAVVDWAELGLPIAAFIFVRISTVKEPCSNTGATITQIHCPDALITECHRITGEWCMLVKVRAASPLALQNVFDAIRIVPGVQETMTMVILSTLQE